MANEEIRICAKDAGVRFWEIAERIGVNEFSFSRSLRHELPESQREKICAAICEIARERKGARA